MDPAIVTDEAKFPEFVHKEIDPGPRCPNHLGQRLLRYFGKDLLRLAFLSEAREQQQGARQSFLAGVEELVNQVLFDSDVSSLLVEHAHHLVFLDDVHGGRCNRGRGCHAKGLACEAPFPKEIAQSKDCYNCLFASFTDDSELHAAILNVHDLTCGITLGGDGFFCWKLADRSPQTAGIEKQLHIERGES